MPRQETEKDAAAEEASSPQGWTQWAVAGLRIGLVSFWISFDMMRLPGVTIGMRYVCNFLLNVLILLLPRIMGGGSTYHDSRCITAELAVDPLWLMFVFMCSLGDSSVSVSAGCCRPKLVLHNLILHGIDI